MLYDLLLRESAGALADVVATRNGGARSGCTSVLHTWGRQVHLHPHVHSVVPAVPRSKRAPCCSAPGRSPPRGRPQSNRSCARAAAAC